MIRIVQIITGLNTGGAEMVLYRLLSRLAPKYHSQVISLTSNGDVGQRIQQLGVSVQALGMISGAVPNPLDIVRLARIIKELRPDIVHTWMYHADLIGGLAARLAGVPAVTWSIRNTDLSKDKTKWTTRATVRICAMLSGHLPDRILSCSEKARDIHVSLGYNRSRFVIIPNGFDITCFRPDPEAHRAARLELGVAADTPVIGLVARFNPHKNHQGFFRAAGILHLVRPDVHFVLAGAAIETGNPQITSWVRNAGIEGVTHLLGLRHDIPRLTAAFDIAACLSWAEAFPNVIGEAMACGVPVVTTDVGDAAYIVGDTGRMVPVGDMSKAAVAMEDLLALPAESRRALGERARSRVAEYFEIGSVVRQYERFYEDLSILGKQNKVVSD